jgi:dolichyl-phosphate-mannose--protein O-mannosyl transferase
MCDAIKIRMVTIVNDEITSLLEFSFSVGPDVKDTNYDIELNENTYVRFGLCSADRYQNIGLGSSVFPLLVNVAKRFGKRRMILWGGVG